MYHRQRSAFTLIELLVVIAIIAILTVVVILTLNPAELLRQARDSNRVADMATVSNALNVYITDQGSASSFSLGIASNTDLSIPDPNGSSTCGNLGLPSFTASSGQAWQCSSATSSRLVNGNGWIPVNLNQISSGAPIGSLPQDPTNQTSSGLFYSYNTNSSQFEVTANLESSKYKSQYSLNPETSLFPELIYGGTPTVSVLYSTNGLAGYWNLDEGSGSSTKDLSGNGNVGTWMGTPAGTSGYYSAGKFGLWGGYFNGSNDFITFSTNIVSPGASQSFSMTAWENGTGSGTILGARNGSNIIALTAGNVELNDGSHDISLYPTANDTDGNWHFVVAVINRNTQILSYYIDGIVSGTPVSIGAVGSLTGAGNFSIGSQTTGGLHFYNGSLDDVRMYNRALSAAEVQALYNAEK